MANGSDNANRIQLGSTHCSQLMNCVVVLLLETNASTFTARIHSVHCTHMIPFGYELMITSLFSLLFYKIHARTRTLRLCDSFQMDWIRFDCFCIESWSILIWSDLIYPNRWMVQNKHFNSCVPPMTWQSGQITKLHKPMRNAQCTLYKCGIIMRIDCAKWIKQLK